MENIYPKTRLYKIGMTYKFSLYLAVKTCTFSKEIEKLFGKNLKDFFKMTSFRTLLKFVLI